MLSPHIRINSNVKGNQRKCEIKRTQLKSTNLFHTNKPTTFIHFTINRLHSADSKCKKYCFFTSYSSFNLFRFRFFYNRHPNHVSNCIWSAVFFAFIPYGNCFCSTNESFSHSKHNAHFNLWLQKSNARRMGKIGKLTTDSSDL